MAGAYVPVMVTQGHDFECQTAPKPVSTCSWSDGLQLHSMVGKLHQIVAVTCLFASLVCKCAPEPATAAGEVLRSGRSEASSSIKVDDELTAWPLVYTYAFAPKGFKLCGCYWQHACLLTSVVVITTISHPSPNPAALKSWTNQISFKYILYNTYTTRDPDALPPPHL